MEARRWLTHKDQSLNQPDVLLAGSPVHLYALVVHHLLLLVLSQYS